MRSILKYDTNRINAQCNPSTKKNMIQKLFGNATVQENPNLWKSEIFFSLFLLYFFSNPHSNVTTVFKPTHRSIVIDVHCKVHLPI